MRGPVSSLVHAGPIWDLLETVFYLTEAVSKVVATQTERRTPALPAALLTTGEPRRQPRCPPAGARDQQTRSARTVECYSAGTRKEVLTRAAAWVSLEDVLLSEIARQKRTNTVGFPLHEAAGEAKFIETETGTAGGCRGRGPSRGGSLVEGRRGAEGEDEEVPQTDGRGGCLTT